jgi:hypothetical protein
MTLNFLLVAMDQVINHAAKIGAMFGGEVRCPLVIRTPNGAGNQLTAQHSQSLEAWFAHTPGLKVVVPGTPYDASGMLRAAIKDPDPVLFLEHKRTYRLIKGEVPDEPFEDLLDEERPRAPEDDAFEPPEEDLERPPDDEFPLRLEPDFARPPAERCDWLLARCVLRALGRSSCCSSCSSSSSPRSPTPRAWAWVTSSSRSCWALARSDWLALMVAVAVACPTVSALESAPQWLSGPQPARRRRVRPGLARL